MARGLVPLGPKVEKELELDLAKLRPEGTRLILFFAEYGLPRPTGAPRRAAGISLTATSASSPSPWEYWPPPKS